MCGIAGYWAGVASDLDGLDTVGRAMAAALRHRGPDQQTVWCDPAAGLSLAHCRLSILDLSAEGAQPMRSATGRYVIVYNGEIYNHLEIRAALAAEGAADNWRGHSDTETLLAAIEAWGTERALKASAGMFAFALWDRERASLTLARDRMGEKPLYFGATDRGLAFASEPKAFAGAPGFSFGLDPEAVAEFLRLSCVTEARSIHAGIGKVAPGGMVTFSDPRRPHEARQYWSFEEVVRDRAPARRAPQGDFTSQSRHFEALLTEVVGSQMISDVPLGSFLSGGIDSSLVTALMMANSPRPVRTFSVGFADADFDESVHAGEVARHLGTDHTAFTVTEADALAVIPDLPRIYDEPFADSSQIPTLLLCRKAREHVTVALSGDGGDEVFGGYNRYLFGPRLWSRAARLPVPIRRRVRGAAGLLHRFGGSRNPVLRRAFAAARLPASALGDIERIGGIVSDAECLADIYFGIVRIFDDPNAVLAPSWQSAPALAGLPHPLHDDLPGLAPAEWMMAMDSVSYLPSDILVKVDRAAMSTSLETRAPYLDVRVVEAAWNLPVSSRIEGSVGKRILRDILYRHVPPELIERPKQGFAIPLDRWLRDELHDWAAALLHPDRLRAAGVLAPAPVQALWQEHRTGQANHGKKLWNIVMLQGWLEHRASEGEPLRSPPLELAGVAS